MLALGVLIASIAVAASARAAEDVDVRAIDALILPLMSKHHVPGVALALIKDGRLAMAKGYGFSDVETRAPVTTETLFNIGSISKSFTALGIAQLADEQKVDLDTPIIKYVPDVRLSDPELTRSLTLRQLLSHSSGLPPDQQWPERVPASRAGIVEEFAKMPATAPPATKFQYCSRCIVLAAYVLERITHQSWENYTRTHIFAPLAMGTASFLSEDEHAVDLALPYHYAPASGETRVPWERLDYLGPLDPAGGIAASVADMARYALFQLGDGATYGKRVVSSRMMAELHRPEIAVPPSWTSVPILDLHYGLGWFIGEYRGTRLIFHNGANPGYRASIVLIPAFRAGVVILTNGESGGFNNSASFRLVEELLR